MAFCGNCGSNVADAVKFCPSCGTTISLAASVASTSSNPGGAQAPAGPPVLGQDDLRDAADNKVMAILAYLGILVLVPLFAAKESKFARYHTNQGLVLLIAGIIYLIGETIVSTICYAIFWQIGFVISTILALVWWGFLALAIIGIIRAVKGEKKPLPLLGGFKILS